MPSCPECGSLLLYKAGLRYLSNCKTVQRWLCRSCGFRFSIRKSLEKAKVNLHVFPEQSESLHSALDLHDGHVVSRNLPRDKALQNGSLMFAEDIGLHNITDIGKRLSILPYKDSKCQVCVADKGAKNLDTATEAKTVVGELNHAETETKAASYVEKLLAQLENDGRKPSTISNYRKALKHLARHGANLLDPENTKQVLAKSPIKPRTKKCNFVPILNYWFDFMGIQWKPPRYSYESEIPYMPTEQEIDIIIAGCGKKAATYLQMLKDTGARCGEISRLKWTSVDFQQKVVRISAEKGSDSRILPISSKAIEMLNNLPRGGERIFANANAMRSSFFVQRRRIARKLANPRLLEIHFHTLRHWKATTEQHRTRDPWHVKEVLGHKSIKSTEVYIHIEKQLYQNGASDEFIVKVATTPKEISALLEIGFEYILAKDDLAYFRRRK